jgi:hypothetical protein
MRKSLISRSIAAMIGGFAMVGGVHAVVTGPAGGDVGGVPPGNVYVVNSDGVGHANIVPYYTVAGNNDTYINITNTDTRNAKALKVRFRGASNSDDVFDFTLLLSPGDVWAAAITKDAETGLPKLVTTDKSCTLPNNISGQKFVTTRLNPALDAAGKAKEASEGYVEIFNMADIPPTTYDEDDLDLYNSIKHVSGVPRDCNSDAVNDLFNDPADYPAAQALGLEVPTTGLMTNWTIINVPGAAAWTGAATAIQAQVEPCPFCSPGYGNIVFFPQSASNVAAALVPQYTADPLLRGGLVTNAGTTAADNTLGTPVIKAASFDFPDMSTPYLPQDLGALAGGNATKRQAYVLSRALSHMATMNEYVTDVGLLAKTDWIFSMPTRRYNVARDYAFKDGTGAVVGRNLFTNWAVLDGTTDPVDTGGGVGDGYQAPANMFTPANTTTVSGQICVTGISTAGGSVGGSASFPDNRRSGITADREEQFVTNPNDFVISPGEPQAPLTFCGEVSVLSFNAGTGASLLGAQVARKDVTVPYADGWLRIATPGLLNAIDLPLGLPTLGFSASRLVNNAVSAGFAGDFGQTFPHRTSRAYATSED